MMKESKDIKSGLIMSGDNSSVEDSVFVNAPVVQSGRNAKHLRNAHFAKLNNAKKWHEKIWGKSMLTWLLTVSAGVAVIILSNKFL